MTEDKRGQPKRRWGCLLGGVGLIVGFTVIVCNAIVGGISRGMDEMIADHPVTYTMPAAAQIIDQYTSKADFFGDFDYCATFRVSDAEYDRLLLNGFNWIYMGRGSTTPTPHVPHWAYGSQAALPLGNSCLSGLQPGFQDSTTYRFLLEEGEDWRRLLIVDEQQKIIFYYRSSW